MDKNKILEMSRMENENKDPYETEIVRKAMNSGHLSMVIVVFVIYISGIIVNGEQDYLVWSIMAVSLASQNLYRGIKLKKKDVLICGVVWSIIFVTSFTVGMIKLIRG